MCKIERRLLQSCTGEVTGVDPGQRQGSQEEGWMKYEGGQVDMMQ